MKLIQLALLFLSSQAYSAFTIPSGLDQSDAKVILDRFAVGFVSKNPGYQEKEKNLNAYASVSSSYLETEAIADLGNGTSRNPLQTQSFHFGMQIPLGVDLGVETSLISDQNRIQQYGGFARWSIMQWGDFQFYFLMHGSSVNLKSLLGVNLYGAQLAASYRWNQFQLYAATGDLRLTSTFQPQLFVSGGTTNVRMSRRYSHQVFRFSYEIDRWTLSAQSDWISKFHNTILISYRL